MKNSWFAFVRFTNAIPFLLLALTASSQKIAIWKGGAPGRSTDWDCAQNWADSRVPNEFSDVLIPDVTTGSGCEPTVRGQLESINSLTLLSGARLRIEKSGVLKVLTWAMIFDVGSLHNDGILQLPVNTANPCEQRDSASVTNRLFIH